MPTSTSLAECCATCGRNFTISTREQSLLNKIAPVFNGETFAIPLPRDCSICREQRRICFRNELKLYRRKCSMTGKTLVSIFSEDKPFPVLDPQVWWSDKFDPLAYGRDVDFSRPFFEQFADLLRCVPKPAIFNAASENSAYTNYSTGNKNCYLLVGSGNCEDSMYCSRAFESRDIIDSFDLYKSELCYECLCSSNLYRCAYCRECSNSSDLFLCANCQGCSNCFGCVNLFNKSYQIFNRQFSKDDYARETARLRLDLVSAEQQFEQLRRTEPQLGVRQQNCEECTGDLLLNCKDCSEVFTLKNSRDCMHSAWGEKDTDCIDCNFFDYSERQYNCSNLNLNYDVMFSFLVWSSQRVMHSLMCYNSQDLFGCTGIKKAQYAILNKQYEAADYQKTAARLARHMRETGEWGKFFPQSISLFGYNETVAADFYPLTEAEARIRGFLWHTESERSQSAGPVLTAAPAGREELLKTVWSCIECGGPHRIQPHEAALHEKIGVPPPPHCFDCRHRARVQQVNKRVFFDRTCGSCGQPVRTVQDAGSAPVIYCRDCYLQAAV